MLFSCNAGVFWRSKTMKWTPVKSHQSAAGADPEKAVRGLRKGLHGLFRQSIGGLPHMVRVSGNRAGLRQGTTHRAHDQPGGQHASSLHSGAQYTAKKP